MKIYLDTSVPNAYFDERSPARQEATKEFWKRLTRHQVFISELVINEIKAIGNESLRTDLLELVKGFKSLSSETEEVKALAKEYVTRGLIPVKYIEDAIHVAVASVNSLDALISWNFEHIVKLQTKREVNVINVLVGYNQLEIIEPLML